MDLQTRCYLPLRNFALARQRTALTLGTRAPHGDALPSSDLGRTHAQSPKEITNSIGMKLVLIPKGTFMMGSPESEEGHQENESQHEVTISKDYYLGVTEVTQGQYERVMGTNPSYFQKRVIRKSDSSMYPVEKVSWEDAEQTSDFIDRHAFSSHHILLVSSQPSADHDGAGVLARSRWTTVTPLDFSSTTRSRFA